MQQTLWSSAKIKQCKEKTGQALLSDESTLVFFSQDFGQLNYSKPEAVFIPQSLDQVQPFIQFAYQEQLPVTLRGNGLSQCGQSLPVSGGMTLCMRELKQVDAVDGQSIWADANASFAEVLQKTLPHDLAPPVLPYNANLCLAGVISAGGVGASSFKYGPVVAHILALDVVDGQGKRQIVNKDSPLFHACLGGQGRCAVILRAQLRLRPVKPKIKSQSLVFTDQGDWLNALALCRDKVDYLEPFCSPAIMGAKLKNDRRLPFAEWLYGLTIAQEYSEEPQAWPDLNAWKVLHEQEESIDSYYLRHNSRFDAMRLLGQWEMAHPWFECFVSESVLRQHLPHLLQELPVHYANLIHVVPVAPRDAGFLMVPKSSSLFALMILNPGISDPLKPACLEAIKQLDSCLLQEGGKRYLSGYLGVDIPDSYWEKHFGSQYENWIAAKQLYDPKGIFVSHLYSKYK